MGITLHFYNARVESSPDAEVSYWEEGAPIEEIAEYLSNIFPDSAGPEFPVIISYASPEALNDPETIKKLVEGKGGLRHTADDNGQLPSDYIPRPMIMIGNEDIMSLNDNDARKIELDPRFRFFDSSIWHRFICKNSPEDFKRHFLATIEAIKSYYEDGLYESNSACEMLELQCRMLKNNYLINLDGGHGKAITPFSYYPESKAKKSADDILQNDINDLKWRCLIIDDYKNQNIRTRTGQANVTKQQLLEKLARQHNTKSSILNFVNYQKEEDSLVKGAIKTLKETEVDVVFLDYLLDSRPGGNPEFGSDLIEQLLPSDTSNVSREIEQKVTLGKVWVFPISVFGSVLRNQILQLSVDRKIHNIQNYIELSNGADPINTPELFRLQLFIFLRSQNEMLNLFKIENVIELLEFSSGGKDSSAAQKKFMKMSANMISHYWYRNAAQDSLKPEGLVTTKRKREATSHNDEYYLNLGLMSHILHLLYLISFASNSDKKSLWQEFRLVRNLAKKLDKMPKDKKGMDALEVYILENFEKK